MEISRETFRKKITSEEKIEKINPENKKLVNRFLRNFETKRSSASVKVYRSNFNIFMCWNLDENENKPYTEIKKIEFVDFFDFAATELRWSPNRYAQMWSCLNSFGSFIENILDEEYPNFKNHISKIEKIPKSKVRKRTVLREEQVDNLLNYLVNEINEPQDACLLALAVCCGARISELFRFTTSLIDENNTAYDGFFLETTEKIVTKGMGKNGKLLNKYILKDVFLPYYYPWLEERAKILKEKGLDHDFLFIRKDGTPANAANGRGWMKRWEYYLTNLDPSNPGKEQVNLYAHCLRSYLCSHLARNNIPQELTVELFGWASANMYNIYNDVTAKDRKWKELENLRN